MYFLVLSVKKKALDEIYRLLHRSDLNISAKMSLTVANCRQLSLIVTNLPLNFHVMLTCF